MPKRPKQSRGTRCIEWDEVRFLLLKIVEQAVRDYMTLEKAASLYEQESYQTAGQFLFEDNYIIDYGGVERSLRDILDILDLDIDWFRQRIVRLKRKTPVHRAPVSGIIKRRGGDDSNI